MNPVWTVLSHHAFAVNGANADPSRADASSRRPPAGLEDPLSATTTSTPRRPEHSFRHEALFYAGRDSFVDSTTPFIEEGLAANEPILVVVSSAKIDLLRTHFDRATDQIRFADMADLGKNPARIIPAWREFVDERGAGDRRVRGIGEPVWAGRNDAELVECQHHESLLNLAFAHGPAWSLLCPYDIETLDPVVINEARRSHPSVVEGGRHQTSPDYRDAVAATLDQPLPEPPSIADELSVRSAPLGAVREFAARRASHAGMSAARAADFVFSVNELVTNSVRHAGGEATVSIWQEADALICEVRDRGHITQPLVGRQRPTPDQQRGRGLWLVNQLCDLVQVRSLPSGNIVRMTMRRS